MTTACPCSVSFPCCNSSSSCQNPSYALYLGELNLQTWIWTPPRAHASVLCPEKRTQPGISRNIVEIVLLYTIAVGRKKQCFLKPIQLPLEGDSWPGDSFALLRGSRSQSQRLWKWICKRNGKNLGFLGAILRSKGKRERQMDSNRLGGGVRKMSPVVGCSGTFKIRDCPHLWSVLYTVIEISSSPPYPTSYFEWSICVGTESSQNNAMIVGLYEAAELLI